MIIVGDLASPNSILSQHISDFFNGNKQILESESILFNLEGLISDNQDLKDNTPILFNHSSVLNIFDLYANKIAALANNHTLDLPHLLNDSKQLLKNRGFYCVGAGDAVDKDFEIIEIFEENQQIFIINACWEFLLYHQNNKNPNSSVNLIHEFEILKSVHQIKSKHPNAKIITYFHWSFDLEIIPSPSNRKFAKDLINAGVSLVVGCHSHCVQGGEKYKDGFIVYGLGNFFIPSNIFANGKLKFPKVSDLGWILKWDVISNSLQNIWIDSSSNNLKLVTLECFENSPTMKFYSGFTGLSDIDYEKYFKIF